MHTEAPRSGFDSPASPLIDREYEVGQMRAALTAALGGSGGIVLLTGEPGIGKTRLAGVLGDQAAALGVPVWWGRGWEDGSAPAFWPWNVALRGWIDRGGQEVIATAAGAWVTELARVFPVLRERIAGVPPNESSRSDRARFRLFESVSRFLATVAAPAGLVIVLDDLHWADRPSLKLLEFIAADLQDARLVIIATYRDTEVGREDPFFATLSRLAREPSTRRIILAGLSAGCCAQWVAPLMPAAADVEALGERLYRETHGNPFFLGEIARLLATDEGLRAGWDVERVPYGVREVIARRLDRLGGACCRTLTVAALLGDTVDARILGEILDDGRAADHLQRAAHDRILVEVEGQHAQYDFAHALIRRVLIAELQPSIRADWHGRIAAVLERRAPGGDDASTQLVRHFAAADTREALSKAFNHACRGAEQAARGLGWEEAVRLYQIALDAGGRSGALDAERGLELRLALAQALQGAGDVAAARMHCEEIVAACRRKPRPPLLAKAVLLHTGPIPELGWVDPTQRALLEEACREAEEIDDVLRARLYARLAGDLIAANEVEQGARVVALCDEAVRAARRARDAGALASALFGRFSAAVFNLHRPGGAGNSVGEPIPSPQEILEAAEAGGMHELAAEIRHLRAIGLLGVGAAEEFWSEIDGLATAAATSRAPEALWLADALAALRATIEGRFAMAQDLMDRAAATGRRMQLPNAFATHVSQRIMWHAFQGRLGDIAPEIDALVDGHPGGHGWQPIRALARLARGDAVGARADFHTLLAAGLGPVEMWMMSSSYLAGLTLLCIELDEREHAPTLYDCVARRLQLWIVDGCHTLGPWPLLLGLLARTCGRPTDAARHFEEAIQLSQEMRALPFVAQAQAGLADALLSRNPSGDTRDQIATMLAEAERRGRDLGLLHVTAQVERLKAQLAARRDASLNAFRREGEIWTVSFRGQDLRLKDGKGPRYLAALLAAPGREIHVLQLAAGAAAASTTAAASEGLSIGAPGGSFADAPDARARREYRARLHDLQAELDEAERFCDRGRAERLRAEHDILMSQLAQRFGAHAHLRGPAETARKAVTKVLRTQIGKLLDAHPLLGQHLREAVRMGTVCVYAPRTPTSWEVAFGRAALSTDTRTATGSGSLPDKSA